MTRPLRIEFPGALYHVTSRGDKKADIYLDDDGRSFSKYSKMCMSVLIGWFMPTA